ncbi:MAG: hypothetical protein ACI9WC_001786 [Arenicella sp.]|jgi:hypothetical protein
MRFEVTQLYALTRYKCLENLVNHAVHPQKQSKIGNKMTSKRFTKLFIYAFFISLGFSSHSAIAEETLKEQLEIAKAEEAAKTAKRKEIEEAIAKKAANVDTPTKTETDKKQDMLLAKLAAGILDDEILTGDTLKLWVNAGPFNLLEPNNEKGYCAPAYAKMKVLSDDDDIVHVNFKLKSLFFADAEYDASLDGNCVNHDSTPPAKLESVIAHEEYTIKKSRLEKFNYKRSGIVYGGLIVPFKYYLGGDKRISSSSTIAPYLGFRGFIDPLRNYGLHVTPVVSAGLGFVPVNKSTTAMDGVASTNAETKTAVSVSTGLVLTHEKNKSFTAGLLIGKDFLSTADRLSDPTVDKLWVSLYIGLSIK